MEKFTVEIKYPQPLSLHLQPTSRHVFRSLDEASLFLVDVLHDAWQRGSKVSGRIIHPRVKA